HLCSLERVNKAPASFDPQKLSAFQERYMQALSVNDKAALALPYLEKIGMIAAPCSTEDKDKLLQVIQAAGDRIKVAGDILDYADFFRPDNHLSYDEAAFEKRIRKPAEAAGLLSKFRDRLANAPAFDAPSLEQLLQDFIKREGVGIGQIIHALRVAVTGKAIGFGVFDSLAILGREHCLARIDRA